MDLDLAGDSLRLLNWLKRARQHLVAVPDWAIVTARTLAEHHNQTDGDGCGRHRVNVVEQAAEVHR